MTTRVIHIRNAPLNYMLLAEYRYIGRPSYLGNPYHIGEDGTREEVIAKYQSYLSVLRRGTPEFFDAYIEHHVKGRILVCYCKPLACHGDVLVELAEGRLKL